MGKARRQITFLRSSLGVSQKVFGKEIGYSQSYVRDIELGRSEPSVRFLEAISVRYGISIDNIWSGVGDRVLRIANKMHEYRDPGFIFLYDFSDIGVEKASNEISKFLSADKHFILDASQLSSDYQLLVALTGQTGSYRDLLNTWQNYVLTVDHLLFVVINKLSQSKIKNKTSIVNTIWQSLSCIGILIVIDKPSLVERYCDELGYEAYPIHFSDFLGKIHT